MRRYETKRVAFSLIELLVVLAIISTLMALLFPVFGTVRGRARQISCASNLHQIGLAFSAYMQDNEGKFPRCVNAIDQRIRSQWQDVDPKFGNDVPRLPMMQESLRPYSHSDQVFRCPGDIGFTYADFNFPRMDAFPSCYEKYGFSYWYHTILSIKTQDAALPEPARINVLFDPVGSWHGTLTPLEGRYNCLFADWHVKNINRSQMDEAWAQPIR